MKSLISTNQPFPPRMVSPDSYQQFSAKGNSAEISLTTKEGDRVTIREDMFQALYQERQTTGGINTTSQATQSLMAGTRTDQSFIQIQGDLNEQEIEDLTELLDDLTEIAGDFFSGNLAEAMTGAMEIGDMGTVATLEATFTQSSVLSTYMATPHPMPQLSSDSFEELIGENQEFMKQENTLISDRLQAQWQQLLDSLDDEVEEPEKKIKHHHDKPEKHHVEKKKSHHEEEKPIKDAKEAGKEMFARSRETMKDHPRLSPLLPSITEMAANNGASGFDHEATRTLMKDLGKYFTKEFHNWLIA